MGGYIGSNIGTIANAAERKQTYSITTATTSLTGLAYTPTKVHVFHNGVRLVDGTDYTATNGTSITLTNAAQNGDEVVVISYPSFQTSDTVSAANGGTFAGNVTMSSDLNVDTIKDTGGTTAMTIDSSGRVSTPVRPAFFAYLNANQSITSSATDEKVLFNAEDFDKTNNFASSEFTAPLAGLYQFNVAIQFEGSGEVSRYVRARIFKNGSTSQIEGHNHLSDETSNSDYSMVSYGAIMDLAANDVISVHIAVFNSNLVISGFNKTTHFSGYFIG